MTLDMVGISEMQKCGLKYVISILWYKKGRAINDPADLRLVLEREERLELPTFFLEGRCSTNWAIPAFS